MKTKKPHWGDNFYRIVRVNRDGNQSFSNISKVRVENVIDQAQQSAVMYGVNGITLSYQATQVSAVSVRLLDMSGRVLSTQSITPQLGNNFFELSTTNLASGVYFLNISTKDYQHTHKVNVAP